MIDFETFTKLPKNVGDLAKLIVAEGFKKLPKVRKIAKSGHNGKEEGWEREERGESDRVYVKKNPRTTPQIITRSAPPLAADKKIK